MLLLSLLSLLLFLIRVLFRESQVLSRGGGDRGIWGAVVRNFGLVCGLGEVLEITVAILRSLASLGGPGRTKELFFRQYTNSTGLFVLLPQDAGKFNNLWAKGFVNKAWRIRRTSTDGYSFINKNVYHDFEQNRKSCPDSLPGTGTETNDIIQQNTQTTLLLLTNL